MYKHKLTNQILELKKTYDSVGIFYNIKNGKRINNGRTVKFEIDYEIFVCSFDNVVKI